MQQRVHILIVDRERHAALTVGDGSRWLLPSIRCGERIRAGPLVSAWLATIGVAGSFAGQWVGRIASQAAAIDWLALVDAHVTDRVPPPKGLSWKALEHLRSSESLLEYQQWALERTCAGEMPVRPGPFGSLGWTDRVRAWAERAAGPIDGPPVCYRATPHEAVLAFSSGGRRVYFKGLTDDRISEATLTATLAVVMPEAFAATIALERQDDGAVWWMTEGCAGTPLAAATDRVSTVVVALARAQRRLDEVSATLRLPDIDLPAALAWARELLDHRVDSDGACMARLAAACESLSAHAMPRSWTPLDLDAGNALVDGDRVRFIDLDRSSLGPAPLAAATLLRRLRRAPAAWIPPDALDAIRRQYESEWQPILERSPRWSDLEVASALLECHAGWQRLLRNVDRGEVSGSLDVAAERIAQRLSRAVAVEQS